MKRVRREKTEIVKDFVMYASVGERAQVARLIADVQEEAIRNPRRVAELDHRPEGQVADLIPAQGTYESQPMNV